MPVSGPSLLRRGQALGMILTWSTCSMLATVWLIYKKMKAEERYNGAVQYTGNGEWVPKYGQPVYQAPPPSYGATQ